MSLSVLGRKGRLARNAVLLASLSFATPARGQTDDAAQAEPAAPPAPPPSPRASDAEPPTNEERLWREHFDKAREELLAGEFAVARDEFQELARIAPSEVDRAIALEDADLASAWLARDLALVRRVDLGETNLTPKAVDRRTSDEIVSLYTAGVVYGIGTGGWAALGIASDRSNPGTATYVLPPILFTGATVGVIALADSQHAFRYGGAQSVVSGMYIGLEEGLVWTIVDESIDNNHTNMSPPLAATVVWGGATAGAIGGGLIGAFHATTPGRASFVGSAALWSAVLSGSVEGAFQKEHASAVAPFTVAGIGLNAGLVGGLILAEPFSPTIARVRFLDLGGASGYLVGLGLYTAAASNKANTQAALGCSAIGSAAGLASAWFFTRSMQDDRLGGRSHEPSTLESLSPTVMPLDHGAAFGVRGTLFE